MIGASVFVLTALTMTGVYVSDKGNSGNNGNLIDFSELEEQAKNQNQEEEQNMQHEEQAKADQEEAEQLISQANSLKVENQKKTDTSNKITEQNKYGNTEQDLLQKKYGNQALLEDTKGQTTEAITAEEESISANAAGNTAFHFSEGDELSWPITGKILLNYSMDKAVFYQTMQQYRYNPSIVIEATVGEPITAAASGTVESVFQDAELGQGIVCALGDDYELTYGQLKDIKVSEGDVVEKGDLIGYVADPTIYYSQEGSNVYFKLTHAGTPVDPMTKLP